MQHDRPIVSAPAPAEGRSVLCPGCGYDLRGASADRCSECGLEIDRAALERSGFPWAHRAQVGRVRAFLKTVWLVTIDSKQLRHETAKAQSRRGAAAFRRWIAVLLTICFAAAIVMLLLGDGIEAIVVVHEPSVFARLSMEGYEIDLLVPWSAGIALRPAPFAYALVLGFYVAGATRSIFRTNRLSPDYADTVESIGDYVAAPLAWLVPAAAGCAALLWIDEEFAATQLVTALITISLFLGLLALGGTIFRAGQWRARTTHGGYPTGFLAMGELLIRWAIGAAVVVGVVPWCVGFIWIFIDSLRA